MLNASYVLIYGHPIVHLVIKGFIVAPRRTKSQEIPRRTYESIKGIALPPGRPTALGTCRIDPFLQMGQGTAALLGHFDIRWKDDGKVFFRNGHDAAAITVNDRNGRSSITLTRHQPIAKPVLTSLPKPFSSAQLAIASRLRWPRPPNCPELQDKPFFLKGTRHIFNIPVNRAAQPILWGCHTFEQTRNPSDHAQELPSRPRAVLHENIISYPKGNRFSVSGFIA